MIDRRVDVTTTAVSELRSSNAAGGACRSESTAVDDHVEIDLTEPVEGLGKVFPDPTEMHCTAWR